MRRLLMVLLAFATSACGGDSSGPSNTFLNAAGVYSVTGGFDDLPSSVAHFEGTLTLTQASQQSGSLGGSAALVATINGTVYNLSDPSLDGATISPSGVISYTMADASGTWTFTGTLSGTTIVDGGHTISNGSESFSGAWNATRTAAGIQSRVAMVGVNLGDLAERLGR